MHFDLTIDSDDDDATADPVGLVQHALERIADLAAHNEGEAMPIFDRNGNRVGAWTFTRTPAEKDGEEEGEG